MSDQAEQLYYANVQDWLHVALFDPDPIRARAAEANLRRALRHEAGQVAALMETASLQKRRDALLVLLDVPPEFTELCQSRGSRPRACCVAWRRNARTASEHENSCAPA